MPYLITTASPPSAPDVSRSGNIVSRRAVATLDEATVSLSEVVAKAHFDCPDWLDRRDAYRRDMWALVRTPESGGTVGPLPDRTVIEVEPASWSDLAVAVEYLGRGYVTEAEWPEVLAAFNAKQASA
jgi:hypothetical protein